MAIGIEEEQGIFVAFLHNPATAVLCVNFHFAVFAAYLLLGQKFVVLIVDLDVGVAVRLVNQCVHIVTIDSVSDEVHLVGVADILAHYGNIGHVIVIPVAIAVQPESGPVVVVVEAGVPEQLVAMHHAVMMGMVEVGSRMHVAM